MARTQSRGSEPSQRMLRVAELVRHVMADILSRGEIQDEALHGLIVSVPRVMMTPDLKTATIYVMPLLAQANEASVMQAVVEGLKRNQRYIRAQIAAKINLKFAPDVRFRAEDQFANSQRIDAILHSPQVRRDWVKHDRDDGDESGQG